MNWDNAKLKPSWPKEENAVKQRNRFERDFHQSWGGHELSSQSSCKDWYIYSLPLIYIKRLSTECKALGLTLGTKSKCYEFGLKIRGTRKKAVLKVTWLVISSSGWLYVFTQLWHTVHTDKHLLDARVAADTCVDVSCGGGGPTLRGGLPCLPFSGLSWKFGRPKCDFLFSFCLGNTLKKITKQKSGSLLPCRYCKHHEAWGEPQLSDSQIMCLGS